jgi:sterol desaturase/sphingolipid hydroxylase (fatty acid hydroxylase superfamily)
MTPQQVQITVVSLVFVGFALLEWRRRGLFPREAGREDNRLDVAVLFMVPVVQSGVLLAATALCNRFIPESQGSLAHWPWWAMLGTLLVADDLTQYLWHWLSHTSVLWPLHRAHHAAGYMSVRVVYRNNLFYYAMMPGLWLAAVLLYLGFGWVYIAYVIVKMTVIIGAHSSVRWDEKLYQYPALHPLMWLLERTISTPATHYAHHALSQDDGIGHYTGNYGNLLFFWDVLFGTAVITRKYPPAFGLLDDRIHGHENWLAQLLFPLVRSHRADSALAIPPGRPPS